MIINMRSIHLFEINSLGKIFFSAVSIYHLPGSCGTVGECALFSESSSMCAQP